jgi:hypothetical protein
VSLVEIEAGLGAARLDQRAAGGQTPGRLGPARDGNRARRAGPAVLAGPAPDDDELAIVAPRLERVAVGAAPGAEVHRERRIGAAQRDAVARSDAAQRAVDEEVRAPVEPEGLEVKVDSRQQ